MEFGLCADCGGTVSDFIGAVMCLSILSLPFALFRVINDWDQSLFELADLARIEFPLPQIVPPTPYDSLPVAMMVGSCSEAKRCAYCHEGFDCESARRFCFACKSATHEECTILNGSCSVFGCSGTTLLRSA